MSDEHEEQREEMRKIGRLQPFDNVVKRIEFSSLPKQDKENLLKFITHFRQMEFNVGDIDLVERLYKEKKFNPPYWLKEIVEIFTGLGIFTFKSYNLKEFTSSTAKGSPRWDRVPTIEYDALGRAGYATEMQYLKTNLYDLFPVLQDSNGGGKLAINGKDHTDRSIYEFDIRDIWDAYSEGGPRKVLEVPVRVFDSYTEMLANISRVMIDGVVYEAQEN
jgi:hypothetical protein